ncbi:uncharacterized protein LOC133133770 [Conger conger]|uniref:uncharacterized protein LOC133133770 n=1 Tax=Conger conger TaxID=82655 RepID=UPI002A5A09DF|nr:uncharacterized protein LOC133133770 [Conger conger]
MDVLTVAALLSLLSVSAAKPLECEDLIQPLPLNEIQAKISGQWIYTEARTNHQPYTDLLKTLNSSLMDIVLSPQNGTAVIKQRHMLSGKCHYHLINLNTSNNTIHRLHANGTTTITVLPSCSDCLVLNFIIVDGKNIIKTLKLYGKTRRLSPSDLEMYQKQAECLGLPAPSFKDDEKQDLCPDEEKPASTEEGGREKSGH